jgi:transcriptional regulator with XRE-family HTH domain
MTLEQYLTETNTKPIAFAGSIGVAPSTITRILRGERSPGIEIIAKIETGTGGKVAFKDWLSSAENAA